MSEWEAAGPRAIRTAFDLYEQWNQPDDGDGPQMSG